MDMIFPQHEAAQSAVALAVNDDFLSDESEVVARLVESLRLESTTRRKILDTARELVQAIRQNRAGKGGLDAFLRQYDLSSREGVVLMCLAEALLRIPDADTADKLIADKLAAGDWEGHIGTSESLFVNASTWGLMLTGRLVSPEDEPGASLANVLGRMVSRVGEPVVRTALRQAMRIMGHQFVMGRNIDEALHRSLAGDNRLYRHSFDMLGEAALSDADAEHYLQAYLDAIDAIGSAAGPEPDIDAAPSISVKLSALFPRYEFAQRTRVAAELTPRLRRLVRQARERGIALTVDAEEAVRLELSLIVFEAVYRDEQLAGWSGLGLALQCYQKRAIAQLDWLAQLAADVGRKIPVRLVKGAYWDTEIKRAQEQGLPGYPVFTRKISTDVSYLACAQRALDLRANLYPQFATHNAHTVAAVLHMAGADKRFEYQRLHGMGEELYDEVVGADKLDIPCRVYAPVGSHEDLLPYLVRRLLENGANTSFVNRIVDEQAPIEEIVADPLSELATLEQIPHPRIPLPADLFAPQRLNSSGTNLADGAALGELTRAMQEVAAREWVARPLIDGHPGEGPTTPSLNPADHDEIVGQVQFANSTQVSRAAEIAQQASTDWDTTPAAERAEILQRAADLFEAHRAELMTLCVKEAGKSIADSVSELREAVDFLRYYAEQAAREFGDGQRLRGPTGESNQLRLRGRGVFVCISPWNFPLAIYTGQVAAALAAGNAVLAKPAEQTSLVAALATQLLHQAGVPTEVLHLLPGEGATIGAHAVAQPQIVGVAFTGSTEVARGINRALAARDGPIATLIAETGGQNAMLVDSSALAEQVVLDVVQSSFNSAGQRCSALRVLYLPEEIAPRVLELLSGYMDELRIGDPALLSTDVGPVIDAEARAILLGHIDKITGLGRLIKRCPVPESLARGTFVAPTVVEIDALDQLEREVFGPILHVIRYPAGELEWVVAEVNRAGYGLTLGVHSRIDSVAQAIARRARVGNVYVNRNMIGAVVGVQPFGGCGLSGTGPKAGGPHYLRQFATEQTLSINTAAVGGNTTLLSLGSD